MNKISNKQKILKIGTSIIVLGLIMVGIFGNASSNMDNWVDSFDSNDSLNDWTIDVGNFSVIKNEGVLVASDCYSESGFCLSSLWRNSTATTGTWSFDLRLSESHTFFMLYFVGHLVFTTHPASGYSVHVNKDKILNLWYRDSNTNVKIDTYTADNETLNNWMHFDVKRNSTGYMEVYLNYIKIMTGQNTLVTESENINFQMDDGAKIDNVSYSKPTTAITSASTSYQGTTAMTSSKTKSSVNSPSFDASETVFYFILILGLIKIGKKKRN